MFIKHSIYSLLTVILMTSLTYSQNTERKDVPEKFKWDNSILYKNVEEWQKDRESIEKEIEKISSFKGILGESSENFYNLLRLYFDIYKSYYKLTDYSFRTADEDVRISANQSLNQQASTLGTKFSEASSFISPEILSIDPAKIKQFFEEKKELNEFKFYIDDILRLKEHTLTAREEELLASAGMVTSTPSEVYGIFDNAEKPNAKVTISTGEEIELTSAAYNKYRTVPNRQDRELVMRSTFENYKKFQNTIGANLVGKLHADYFYAKNRKYKTVLESALNANNIPVSVYENLINQ